MHLSLSQIGTCSHPNTHIHTHPGPHHPKIKSYSSSSVDNHPYPMNQRWRKHLAAVRDDLPLRVRVCALMCQRVFFLWFNEAVDFPDLLLFIDSQCKY